MEPKTTKSYLLTMLGLVPLLAGSSILTGCGDPEVPQTEEVAYVTAAVLNLRQEPGSVAKVVGKLMRQTAVRIRDRRGDWLYVRLLDGREGWIHGTYVGTLDDVAASARAEAERSPKGKATRTETATPQPVGPPAATPQGRAVVGAEQDGVEAREYSTVSVKDIGMKALGHRRLSHYSSRELEALPRNVRMSYKILVPSDISEPQLKATLAKVIRDKATRNPDIDEMYVTAYDRIEDTDVEYFGQAHWHPGADGVVTAEIAESNHRTGYVVSYVIRKRVSDKQMVRPTQRELAIYRAYKQVINDREQIAKLDPPLALRGDERTKWEDKRWEERDTYKRKGRERIARKYGITPEAVTEIYIKVLGLLTQ